MLPINLLRWAQRWASKEILLDLNSAMSHRKVRITKTYKDFYSTGTSKALSLMSLPAEGKILDVYANVKTIFATPSYGVDINLIDDGTSAGVVTVANPTGLVLNNYISVKDSDSSAAFGYIKTIGSDLGENGGALSPIYDFDFTQDGTSGGIVEIDDNPVLMTVGKYMAIDDSSSPILNAYMTAKSGNLGDGATAYDTAFSEDGTAGGILTVASITGMTSGKRVSIADNDTAAIRGYMTNITANLGAGASAYDQNFIVIDGQSDGTCYVASSTGMAVGNYLEVDDNDSNPKRGYLTAITQVGAGSSAYSLAAIEDGTVAGKVKVASATGTTVGDFVHITSAAPLSVYGIISVIDVIGEGAAAYDQNFYATGTAGGICEVTNVTGMHTGKYVEIHKSTPTSVRGYIVGIVDEGGATTAYDVAFATDGTVGGLLTVSQANAANMAMGQLVEVYSSVVTTPIRGYIAGMTDLGATVQIYLEATNGGGGVPVNISTLLVTDTAKIKSHGYFLLHIQTLPTGGSNVNLSTYTVALASHIYSLACTELTFTTILAGVLNLSAYLVTDTATIASIACKKLTVKDAPSAGSPVDLSMYSIGQVAHIYSINAYKITIKDAPAGSVINLSAYTVSQAAGITSLDCWQLTFKDAPSAGTVVNLSAYTTGQGAHVYAIDAYKVSLVTTQGGATPVNLSAYTVSQVAHIFDNVSALTISVGRVAALTDFVNNTSVLSTGLIKDAASKGSLLTTPGQSNIFSISAATDIQANLIITGAPLSVLSQGEIEIFVEYSD